MSQIPSPSKHRLQRAIAWILGIAGIAILIPAVWFGFQTWQSMHWPTTHGVISWHETVSVMEYRQVASKYKVAVRYRYTVNGKQYEGKQFSHSSHGLTTSQPSREEASQLYATDPAYTAYQPGSSVTVYYDANHPANAVLKPGSMFLPAGLLILGGLLTIISLIEFWRLRKIPVSSGA